MAIHALWFLSVAQIAQQLHMTGLHSEDTLSRYMGTYERREPPVNGRPAYVLTKRRTTALWYAGGSWWIGPVDILGTRSGLLHSDDQELSAAAWLGWRHANNSWMLLPSTRVLSGAAAASAVAAVSVELERELEQAAATVYFVGSKMDRLRREWLGAYKRQRDCSHASTNACITNGRYTYTKDGSTTKMMCAAEPCIRTRPSPLSLLVVVGGRSLAIGPLGGLHRVRGLSGAASSADNR